MMESELRIKTLEVEARELEARMHAHNTDAQRAAKVRLA
jgi:hypothetical protein